MVDPNRKINRLTEKDVEFLDECEEEFKFRFTNDDEDFMKHIKKETVPPPIVDPWMSHSGGRGNNSGGGGYRNHRGGRFNNRNNSHYFNRRGGRDGGNKNFDSRWSHNRSFNADGSSSGSQRYN